MVTDKRISDAELDLMEALWASREPLTSADVAERLEARGWSLATIKTMLSRLVTKGAGISESCGLEAGRVRAQNFEQRTHLFG